MIQITIEKQSIKECIDKADVDVLTIRKKHLNLLNSSAFLRDDKAKDHFCVYFAGVDQRKKKVLLGHHKKAGLWLFNGGHLDSNETVKECLLREMREEWGVQIVKNAIIPRFRLSITSINNSKQPDCSRHFDLWHFVDLDCKTFEPNMNKLDSEFYEMRWVTIQEALKLSEDQNTKTSLRWLQDIIFNRNNYK